MAKEKKLVEAITSMDVDFAQWYTDVVKKAELIEYSSVKGCMVIKPAGYAIWEKIDVYKRQVQTAVRRRGSLALCAVSLSFDHPVTGRRMTFAREAEGEGFSMFQHV